MMVTCRKSNLFGVEAIEWYKIDVLTWDGALSCCPFGDPVETVM
jgi:hypothetical protein